VGLGRFEEREINERSYVFVQQRNLTVVNLNQHIEAETRNPTILRGTQNATSYTTEGGHVVNRGISVERFEKETGQVVPRHTLVDSGAAGSARVSGNQVEMYRPKLSDATPKNPPPGVSTGTSGGASGDLSRKQEKAARNAQSQQQGDQQNQTKQQRKIQAQQEQERLNQERLNKDKQQRKIQAQQEQERLNREKQQRKADQQAQDQARRQQKLERKQQKQNQSTPKKEKNKNPST
jgi:hypothetical protein